MCKPDILPLRFWSPVLGIPVFPPPIAAPMADVIAGSCTLIPSINRAEWTLYPSVRSLFPCLETPQPWRFTPTQESVTHGMARSYRCMAEPALLPTPSPRSAQVLKAQLVEESQPKCGTVGMGDCPTYSPTGRHQQSRSPSISEHSAATFIDGWSTQEVNLVTEPTADCGVSVSGWTQDNHSVHSK